MEQETLFVEEKHVREPRILFQDETEFLFFFLVARCPEMETDSSPPRSSCKPSC